MFEVVRELAITNGHIKDGIITEDEVRTLTDLTVRAFTNAGVIIPEGKQTVLSIFLALTNPRVLTQIDAIADYDVAVKLFGALELVRDTLVSENERIDVGRTVRQVGKDVVDVLTNPFEDTPQSTAIVRQTVVPLVRAGVPITSSVRTIDELIAAVRQALTSGSLRSVDYHAIDT